MTSGTVYDEYRHNYTSSNTASSGASTLWASTFYVVTSDYNVYKVISNNNGANSTVMPTGTSTNILTTADGYKWKFMYSISASDVIKFVTSDFIPVKTIGAKAIDGEVGALGSAVSDDNSAQWDVENGATDELSNMQESHLVVLHMVQMVTIMLQSVEMVQVDNYK